MSESNKKIALVDGENVGSLSKYSSLPPDYEIIYYFLGATQRLSPELTGKNSDIRVVEIAKIGKNNLDFHLAAYLGYLHKMVSPDFIFEVISKDTGFDGIISFINQNWKRKCRRMDALYSEIPREIIIHFVFRDGLGLPKNVKALRNYLIASSLSTTDNVDDDIEILFEIGLLYLDCENRIRYNPICC